MAKTDYIYENEAVMFEFYHIPQLLFIDEKYKEISSEAKILYGIFLSKLNRFPHHDSENKAYIICSIDEVAEYLHCSKPTAGKVLDELDSQNGVGLIEKVRRGFGTPNAIYVKDFATGLR